MKRPDEYLTEVVYFNELEKKFDGNLHPEVQAYKKIASEVKNDYVRLWAEHKEDNLISKENFMRFFLDIANSIPDGNDFLQVLRSCGFNE